MSRTQVDQDNRTVLQASKDRRLARLGVVVTVRNGMTTYDYPVSLWTQPPPDSSAGRS